LTETSSPRVIKKYPNRRLYDTETSRYVTLQQIRDLVLDDTHFVVIDKKSAEDITRSILLQIILEQESETNPLFSNDNLERFIRFYDGGSHLGFSEFIGQNMNFFQQQQREFGKAMEGMTGHNPLALWQDLTEKNVDRWRQMMGMSADADPTDKN